MKLIIKMFLCLLAVFGITTALAPQTVFAYEATVDGHTYVYYLDGNDNAVITGYNGPGGDVEIPSMLDGYTVTSIGEFAFNDCYNLKSVTIPDSVTSIGDCAFQNCPGLASITIPDSVTSIGNCAFFGCNNLKSVTIPDSVMFIGDYAFAACNNLTSVTIPDSVTSIGDYAFLSCNTLTDIYYTGTQEQWDAIPKGTDWNDDCPLNQQVHCGIYSYTVNSDDEVTITGYNGPGGDVRIPSKLGGNPVMSIGDSAFESRTSLGSVALPDNINYGGSKTQWDAVSKGADWDAGCNNFQRINYGAWDVKITAGANMAATSGEPVQVVKKGTDMASVTFTAATDSYFPADYSVPNLPDGFSVARNSDGTQITVSGKPKADAEITLPAAKRKMTITAKNQTYVYNGKHQGPGDTVHNDQAEITELIDVEGLQAGDFVYSIIVDGQGDIIGESELVPQSAVIYDSNNKPVTDNYNISYVNGTLSIVHVIDVSAADISRGDTETIEVTTPKEATGTVTLKIKYPDDSEKTYSVAMTAGKGQLELEDLPVGAYDVTAEYSIDPTAPESQRYADDSNTASFKVTEKPVTTFTVSFDANGGSGKMEKMTGVSGEYTLPECTFTAPDDKAFDCWMVGNDTYAPGDKIAVDADTTVTAQWKDAPPVHVHTLDLVDAKEATCTEEGNTAYYVCTGCGLWFEDKTALVEITDKSSVIIRPTGHKWDNGVVTKEPTYTEAGIRTYTCLNDSSHKKEEVIPKKQRSSGGGSSSSSSGGSVSGKRSAGGSWSQDASGWHYKENGVLLKNAWKYLPYNGVSYWYYFDETGTMKTGWLEQNGNRYYLYPVSDGWMGRMVTGWQQIEGKWYFFETASGKDQGRMYRSERTPDGYYTGPDGAWDGNPAEQGA